MKPNVENTLKTMLVYLVLLFGGIISASVIYMIYQMCTNLVAGQGFSAFDLQIFLTGILRVTPVVFVLSSAFIGFYFVRRGIRQVLPSAVFCGVYVISWLFILPLVISSGNESFVKLNGRKNNLSAGYFRDDGQYVFYYSKVSGTNVASGFCIDKLKTGEEDVYTFKDVMLSTSESGFTDLLIQQDVEVPSGMRVFITAAQEFLFQANYAISKGFVSWLCFASMCLPLAAVFLIVHLSEWRLVSVVNVIVIYFATLLYNIGFLATKSGELARRLNGFIPFISGRYNPTLVLANLLFCVLIVIYGIIMNHYMDSRASAFSGDEDL